MGIIFCFLSFFSGCNETEELPDINTPPPTRSPVPTSVVVVGAGTGGLTVGYQLRSLGYTDVLQILEARSAVGGRVQDLTPSFAGVPLDAGALFLYETPAALRSYLATDDDRADLESNLVVREFVPNSAAYCLASIDVGGFDDDAFDFRRRQRLLRPHHHPTRQLTLTPDVLTSLPPNIPTPREYGCDTENPEDPETRLQIVNGTFFSSYVARYLLPPVVNTVRTGTVVTQIDYTNPNVIVVTLADGTTVMTEAVVLAVPLTALSSAGITFVPALPPAYTQALDAVERVPGFRAWLEFSEPFFDDDILVQGAVNAVFQRSQYYKAVVPDSNNNERYVLTLQQTLESVNRHTLTDEAIVAELLSELDGIYNATASATFVQATIQNWSTEDYIGYTLEQVQGGGGGNDILATPLDNRIYFTGAYVREATTAMASAVQTARTLLQLE